MKVLHSIALLAVIGSALLVACGDDDDEGGVTPAKGGSAGSAGSAGAAGSTAGAAGSTAGAAGSTAGGAGEAGAAGSAAGAAGEAGAAGAAGSAEGGACVKGPDCVTCCAAANPAGATEIMTLAATCECAGDAGACTTQCASTLCDPDAGMPDETCQTCLFGDGTCVAAIAGGCTSADCTAALACLSACM